MGVVGPAHDDDRAGLELRQGDDVDDLAVRGRVRGAVARGDGEGELALRLVVHRETRAPDALHAGERELTRLLALVGCRVAQATGESRDRREHAGQAAHGERDAPRDRVQRVAGDERADDTACGDTERDGGDGGEHDESFRWVTV